MEEQQRQELLQRSHGAVDYMSQRGADAQSMSYIDNSKRVVEEAFQTGTAVLQNMSGQRERLKVTCGQIQCPDRPLQPDCCLGKYFK